MSIRMICASVNLIVTSKELRTQTMSIYEHFMRSGKLLFSGVLLALNISFYFFFYVHACLIVDKLYLLLAFKFECYTRMNVNF